MSNLVRKVFQTETKASDTDRVLTVKISTASPDRSRDVVLPKGAKIDNYLRNPVVALSHKYDQLAIAKTEDLLITDEGITAKLRFPKVGVYSVADTVYEMYKDGFMNAWSIGFIPDEVEDIEGGGRLFKSWELLEYSAVLVPDNPEALTLVRSKGIDTKDYEKLEKQDDVVIEPAEPVVSPVTPAPVVPEPAVVLPADPATPPVDSPTAPATPAVEDTEQTPTPPEIVAEVSAVDTDETKGRKVLRGKAKSLVVSVLEQVQALTQSLQVLLELEVPSEEDEEKQRTKMVIGL